MDRLNPSLATISLGKTLSRKARRWPVISSVVHVARVRSRKDLLKALPRNAVAAEIGVWKGNFSQWILDVAKPRELHLIDPWIYSPSAKTQWHGGDGGEASNQSDMDGIFRAVEERFEGRAEVTIHRRTSEEAAADFPDGYFDWVYLDGDHSYESVRLDLQAYIPKVKPSGLIGGDDFYWAPAEGFPVKRTVEEAIRDGSLRLTFQKRGQWLAQRPEGRTAN